jgi:ABC-2 type transport system ATP-binding protein
MCDSLLFIDAGRIVHHGSAESLTRDEGATAVVEIRVVGATEALENWLAVNAGWRVMDRRRDGVLAEFQSDQPGDLALQLRRLVGEGIEVIDFHRREKRLEDAFVELLRKEHGRGGPPPVPGQNL